MFTVAQPLTERTPAQIRRLAAEIRRRQREAVKAMRRGENAAANSVVALIKQLRDDIRALITAVPPSEFQAYQLNRLLIELDQVIGRHSGRIQQAATGGINDAFQLGKHFVQTNMADFGVPPILISDEMLGVVQSLSTELITGLARETRQKVRAVLQRSVLGAQTPYDAAKQIDTIIGVTMDSGITYRAERIVRTEFNRAFNAADEEARYELGRRGAVMKKMWMTARDGRVRQEHEDADGQVVDIDEPFEVGGEQLDYPLDPKGSAWNTINCRCTTLTFPAELEDEFTS